MLVGDRQVTATVTGAGPGVRRVIVTIDGEYLLTDFDAPYSFVLPSARWPDGPHMLGVSALLRDGFTSASASTEVRFANGVSTPSDPPADFAPRNVTGSHPVIAAVGDGADGGTGSSGVVALVDGWDPDLLLYLGDVYEKGTATEFLNWYDGDGWGALRPITNPTIGNHEYENGSAPGYFAYWHQPPHFYSFDAGGWRVITIDSTSQFGQTGPSTPQYRWLEDQLEDAGPCALVYFHHPVFSVGPQGDEERLSPIWRLIVRSGVDLVLAGHDHNYQRWRPLGLFGQSDADGPTQFVVGTGGHGIQAFARTDARVMAGFDTTPAALGALRLTLNPAGASFGFSNLEGGLLDHGSVQCSGTPPDGTDPTTVTDLTASLDASATGVSLRWTHAHDNVGVVAYEVRRDGGVLATVHQPAYEDRTAEAGASYSYEVRARDAAGNLGAASNAAVATVPADDGMLFIEDFESGSMAAWSASTGLIVEDAVGIGGSHAARATTSGANAAFAWDALPAPRDELFYRLRFRLVSRGPGTTYIARLRTPSHGSLLGVYLAANGRLAYRNDISAAGNANGPLVTPGVWHELQVRASIGGGAGSVEVWLDGVRIDALSRPENLGNGLIGRIQIGDNAMDRTYDLLVDDVAVAASFLPYVSAEIDTAAPMPPADLTAVATTYTRIDLSWTASTDDVGVAAYDIYRVAADDDDHGFMLVDSVPGGVTAWADVVEMGTTYHYAVRARDTAGNVSAASDQATATTGTPPTSGTFTFDAAADAYVDAAAPTTTLGSSTSLRIDAAPGQVSYLRFDLTGVIGSVDQVTLRLYPLTNHQPGCSVHPVADVTWDESRLTWETAPQRAAGVASCGPLIANAWVDVDLSEAAQVTGNGTLSLALTNPSSTSGRLASRESAFAPQLVVSTVPTDP